MGFKQGFARSKVANLVGNVALLRRLVLIVAA